MNPWDTYQILSRDAAIRYFNWALDGQKLGIYEIKVSGMTPNGTVTFTVKGIPVSSEAK